MLNRKKSAISSYIPVSIFIDLGAVHMEVNWPGQVGWPSHRYQ